MRSLPPSRRRLGAAVVAAQLVVLVTGAAATAGPVRASATAVAAASSPGAATAGAAAMPFNARLLGAGPAGFLSYVEGTMNPMYWTSYADRKTTLLSGSSETAGGQMYADDSARTATNAATGATFPLPKDHTDVVGTAGDAVFTEQQRRGGADLKMHTALGSRDVTGLPAGAARFEVGPATETHGLVAFTGPDGTLRHALVDLDRAAVTETIRPPKLPTDEDRASLRVTDTHLVWTVFAQGSNARAVVRERSTGRTSTVELAGPATSRPQVGVVGGWLVHGTDSARATEPSPAYSLRATRLSDGAVVTLLDRFETMVVQPDGVLLVSGGGLKTGQGAYRVSARPGEEPAAVLVARTGSPAGTAERSPADVPTGALVMDADRVLSFTWYVNHRNTEVEFVLRHVPTGRTYRESEDLFTGEGGDDGPHPDGFPISMYWSGAFDSADARRSQERGDALDGEYVWEMTASSGIGVGPPIRRTGTFLVVSGNGDSSSLRYAGVALAALLVTGAGLQQARRTRRRGTPA